MELRWSQTRRGGYSNEIIMCIPHEITVEDEEISIDFFLLFLPRVDDTQLYTVPGRQSATPNIL